MQREGFPVLQGNDVEILTRRRYLLIIWIGRDMGGRDRGFIASPGIGLKEFDICGMQVFVGVYLIHMKHQPLRKTDGYVSLHQ